MSKEEIGKIKSFSLGTEDHGIFTMVLHIDFRGSSQAFGHFALDQAVKKNGKFVCREGTAWGMNFIMKVMEVVDVKEIQELTDKRVTVVRDKEGWGGKIIGLKSVSPDKEKSFFPEKDLKQYINQ